MGPTIVLGPNRFQDIFLPKILVYSRTTCTQLCLNVFNGSQEMGPLNDTCVVLIPKNGNLKKVFEYQSISLYNVVYKVITKTLANRLKLVLPGVILDNQSICA